MKYILHIILLLFLLIGCDSSEIKKEVKNGVLIVENPEHGLWQKESIPPISFELEKTFGKENEPKVEILSGIGSVFTDNNKNVYIFDRKDNRLVAFDFDGNFLWSKGREGQGPGEFNRTYGAICDGEEYIYVSNISGTRIDRFDLNGNYQKSYTLASLKIAGVSLIGFIKPNILVATQSITGECGICIILFELNDTLKIRNKIDIVEDIGVKIPSYVGIGMDVNVLDEMIAVGNYHNYEIKYYNIEGKLIKKVTRDFEKLVRPGVWANGNYQSVATYGSLSAPMKLLDKYEISYSSWPINLKDPDRHIAQSQNNTAPELKYQNMIDLFNSEGELLYSIYNDSSTPEIGNPIHVDNDGKLYTTIYDPFPQVRRYKVIINKK